MLAQRAAVVALVALPAVPVFGASLVAVGPDAVVPYGGPMPASYVVNVDAACDNLGVCGEICPSGASAFVGDFAYDIANGRFAVIDVTSPDGIFWMDASSCEIGDYGSFAGISQRGCAIDNGTNIIYTGGWNDYTIWRVGFDFDVLGSQYIGEDYAGLAVDEENELLYATTNTSSDELIRYTINEDGSVAPTGERWSIPWRGFSDGYSAAALEYDDCSSTFMIINQDANTMEYFQIQGGDLINVGHCGLPLGFGWGFGLNFATVELKVADVASFACDFPVFSVEPEEMICGGGEIPDFTLRYDPLITTAVRFFKLPWGAKVKNNTDQTETRVLWVELDLPAVSMPVGTYSFAPGSNQVYDNFGPIALPKATYSATAYLGRSFMGTPEAESEFEFSVTYKGIH